MGELKLKVIGEEIEKINVDIDAINELKQIAISNLESQKRDVKDVGVKAIGRDIDVRKELESLAKTLPDLAQRLEYLKKENEQEHVPIEEPISIFTLDFLISDMDKNISKLEADRINEVNEMETKRRDLIRELEAIEQINLLTNALTYKMYEMQHSHRKKLESHIKTLNKLKEEDDGNVDTEKLLEIEHLEKKIRNLSENHEDIMKSLELQKSELLEQYDVNMSHIDDVLQDLNYEREKIIEMYEEELRRTIDEKNSDDIRRKILRLKEQIREEAKFQKNSEEKMLSILEDRGLRMTPSGRFLTKTGRLHTFDEAEHLGLLREIDKEDLNRIFKCYADTETTHTIITTTLSSVESFDNDMDPEDVHYLKKTVANPLVLALAEIVAKQPRDPIHYLGHWLIKYRYNQELDEKKKAEVEALMNERERLFLEKQRRELEIAAQQAVWDMVYRAVEEALRREMEAELLRIAMEGENLEGEYDDDLLEKQLLEEARDTMGVYNGPPTRSRRVWDQK